MQYEDQDSPSSSEDEDENEDDDLDSDDQEYGDTIDPINNGAGSGKKAKGGRASGEKKKGKKTLVKREREDEEDGEYTGDEEVVLRDHSKSRTSKVGLSHGGSNALKLMPLWSYRNVNLSRWNRSPGQEKYRLLLLVNL